MKHIKPFKIFESVGPYIPTHEELENLPVFKEIQRAFAKVSPGWTTGRDAYSRGTRTLRVHPSVNWSFYPYKGTIVRVEGGGTQARGVDFSSPDAWDDALLKIFISSLGELSSFTPPSEDWRIDPDVFHKILKTKRTYVRDKFFAKYPGTPTNRLRQLFELDDPIIDERIAENPAAPEDLMYDLFNRAKSRSRTDSFLSPLAQNPNCPPDILDEFAKSSFYLRRKYVAMNPNTSIPTLVKLSQDENQEVRQAAINNPNYTDPTEWALGDW